ncbi:glycosyltransferase family 4 protein [Alkaliflexus imshenetskii]|uniref:glycosyltransferase family 4 protein n=1 Tax=Alkaliflexus imshenetskii TaxID=286730 RepID=UPI0004B2DC7B|nr:glycosyltransferase family 4 protein [Alkaliflexus imshenetskii]
MKKSKVVITVINNLVTDQRVAKLASHLCERGFDVTLVGRRFPGGDIPRDRLGHHIRFRLLFNRGPLFYAEYNLRLTFFLLFHRYDKIISVDLDTLMACSIAGRIKGLPVIFDSHEYFPEQPEVVNRPVVKRLWTFIEKLLVPRISKGITVSPGIVEIYRSKYGCNFHLVRNIPSSKGQPFDIRPVGDNPIVYYQGALNVGRGLEASIEAMRYLPRYRMLIVGSGDVEQNLKELTAKLGLNERVTFVGKVPFEELPSYALKAHVGLCLLENMGLNYYHSLPNRIFDYPFLGLPVIATSFPDISNIVTSYNTGLLVDTLSPIDIADAIREACENKQLRDEWSRTLPMATSKLTWENELKVFDELF